MEVSFLNPEQTMQIVMEAMTNVLAKNGFIPQKADILPDRVHIEHAELITGLSKSKIYKLTMTGDIPFSKFSNKLVFSRKELLSWIDANTKSNSNYSAAIIVLAKSANKKREATR